MSLIEVNFVSKQLAHEVTFSAVVPVETPDMMSNELDTGPFPTLYLLHGSYGNYTDFISGTRIQRWANEHRIAVVMPSGANEFYVDKAAYGSKWGTYVGQELVEYTRALLPLSDRREDTYIAGLSMGGYGALINGLKYHDTFGRIGAFSPGILNEMILNHTGNYDLYASLGLDDEFYRRSFDDGPRLKGTDLDCRWLVSELKRQRCELPRVYMTVGRQDSLRSSVRDYRDFLLENGVDLTYVEDEGGHEWDFWDRQLKKFVDWLPERR